MADTRFQIAHLVNPAHKLPVPGTKRFFADGDAGETIDTWAPYWITCLRDGSIALGPRAKKAPAPIAPTARPSPPSAQTAAPSK